MNLSEAFKANFSRAFYRPYVEEAQICHFLLAVQTAFQMWGKCNIQSLLNSKIQIENSKKT